MRTNRRVLLQLAALHPVLAPLTAMARATRSNELPTDVAVIGGGVGGTAAALALAQSGRRVVMTEQTDWIGGQLTAQAVPPDEHPWVESFGVTRSYRRFRDGVRAHYRNHYPMSVNGRAAKYLNPGNGSVSKLCHEPKVALAVLHEMLAPYTSSGRVTILHETIPIAADLERDRVRAVTVQDVRTGRTCVLAAKYFLDATELGDLLPLTRTEYVTGAESQKQTGEPHAPAEAQPANHQAFTCCFAMDYLEGEDHTIEKPREYDFWRDYLPQLRPPWPGRLLDWSTTHPITLKARPMFFDPTSPPGKGNLWIYRRIADRKNFAPGTYAGDLCLVNWPQNDYWLGNLCEVGKKAAEQHLARAKQLSLSLLYWMQTAAPRPDGGAGWKGLRLRRDIVDTDDGLAKHAYIRESRRIKAEFTVKEQHVGVDARKELFKNNPAATTSERFVDSVGVGSYRIDLHPSSGGDNYIDVGSLPFQIPLGALLPLRTENLLPACKNLGVTHITNGCYRLHPVEWNIGESAGLLAAFCVAHNQSSRRVRSQPTVLAAFQKFLQTAGVELQWPANPHRS